MDVWGKNLPKPARKMQIKKIKNQISAKSS
jgi:hypothetical protein